MTRGSGSDVTMAGLWTARQGADGKDDGPCKLCPCLDLSLPSPSLTSWLRARITRIGLQDDMTFVGSAAALNRSWCTIEGVLTEAGHRLRSCKCGVWAPGFEQFEDAELPMDVRNLCLKIPRKRLGVSLLGSATCKYNTS